MRVVEDEDGERFLEIENKEDLEEFRKMLIEACYELSRARKPSYETQSQMKNTFFVSVQEYLPSPFLDLSQPLVHVLLRHNDCVNQNVRVQEPYRK